MGTTPSLKDAWQWVRGNNPGFDTSSFLRNPYNSAAVGGLAGAGLGGVLSGGLAMLNDKENESKENRRKRILRQALLGTTLGGTMGAAVGPVSNVLRGVRAPDNKLDESIVKDIKKPSTGGPSSPGDEGFDLGEAGKWLVDKSKPVDGDQFTDLEKDISPWTSAAGAGVGLYGTRNAFKGQNAVNQNLLNYVAQLESHISPNNAGGATVKKELAELYRKAQGQKDPAIRRDILDQGLRRIGGRVTGNNANPFELQRLHQAMMDVRGEGVTKKKWFNLVGPDVQNRNYNHQTAKDLRDVFGVSANNARQAVHDSVGKTGLQFQAKDWTNEASKKKISDNWGKLRSSVGNALPQNISQSRPGKVTGKVLNSVENVSGKAWNAGAKSLNALRRGAGSVKGVVGPGMVRTRMFGPRGKYLPKVGLPGLVGRIGTQAVGGLAGYAAPNLIHSGVRHLAPHKQAPDSGEFLDAAQKLIDEGHDLQTREKMLLDQGWQNDWVQEHNDMITHRNSL